MSIPNIFFKTARDLAKQNKNIQDIILFGSFVKGKTKVNDVDILIIFASLIDKSTESDFKKKLSSYVLDINSVTLDEFRSESFIAKEGIFLEGISLLRKKAISQEQGFFSIALVKYKLDDVKGSKRTRLYYALNGRNDQKGFLKEIGAKRFSQNSIFFPYEKIEEVKQFFELWGVEIQIIPTMIPLRLKHLLLGN